MFRELYTAEGEKLKNDPHLIPWIEHPRPLMERDSFFNLCGPWDFSAVENGHNLLPENTKIRVPFPPESLLSGINRHFPEGSSLIYERHITVPEDFRKDKLLLHIDAADQHAKVYLNGTLIGSHDGGYEHFSFDISFAPDVFDLRIEVTDDLTDLSEPYGKQTVKRGGMWYTPFSGIWQSVWIESVCEEYIKSITINSDMKEAFISTDMSHNGTVLVETPSGTESFPLINGKAEIIPSVIRLWSPSDPYLYRFTLSLDSGDCIHSYFALRKISIGSVNGIIRILFNEKPFFFNALLDQGYYSDGLSTPASPAMYESDIKAVKALGFNTLRKHIKVEPDLFYAYCDRLGIIVFQDMVNNGYYSFFRDTVLPNIGVTKRNDKITKADSRIRETFIKRCRETVSQLSSFPSILYWTIFNEGWGQFESEKLYGIIKELLPDAVIDAASGWFDMGASDVKSIHKYNGKYRFAPSDKPVILSEFGGFSLLPEGHAFNEEKVYGYGAAKSPKELTVKIDRLYQNEISPAIKQGLCGSIYTQLSDVEDEVNGILSYDRRVTKLLSAPSCFPLLITS